MALSADSMRCGEFRTTYKADTTIFPTPMSRNFAIAGVLLLLLAPLVLSSYQLNLLIQIGYYGIAALGLNMLVGFSGQISLGHGAFFGFGAFASAWLYNTTGIPVILVHPLAGRADHGRGHDRRHPGGAHQGAVSGHRHARGPVHSRGLLQPRGVVHRRFRRRHGRAAVPVRLYVHAVTQRYFYVVLAFVVVMFLLGANLLRSRDGRAFVALRDHYLSAEIMGINLTKYRMLAFGVSSFYAGIGGALFAHYLGFVSAEGFTIVLSIQFLGMIIIGGLGSVMGTLLGTAFMVLLPEVMDWSAGAVSTVFPGFSQGLAYLREMAIGLAIVLFLIFEPDGLAHRWKLIKAYWKLYPFSY
ncbi:MAG: branched-chain amino acid ABC transporter permease [Arhodomonas sp.]|nr:branched-chain amino acid ABC transporter permease [Arhodomonas sp.]